jgi:hypothetical protein
MLNVLGAGVEAGFSWRYGVIGFYRDRDLPLLRVHPCPFARVTVTYRFRAWAASQVRKGQPAPHPEEG